MEGLQRLSAAAAFQSRAWLFRFSSLKQAFGIFQIFPLVRIGNPALCCLRNRFPIGRSLVPLLSADSTQIKPVPVYAEAVISLSLISMVFAAIADSFISILNKTYVSSLKDFSWHRYLERLRMFCWRKHFPTSHWVVLSVDLWLWLLIFIFPWLLIVVDWQANHSSLQHFASKINADKVSTGHSTR